MKTDTEIGELFRDILRDYVEHGDGETSPPPPETLRGILSRTRQIFHVGITGTRESPSIPQALALSRILNAIARQWAHGNAAITAVEIHHGMCTGTDETAHYVGRKMPDVRIHGHPGTDAKGNAPYRMPGGVFDVTDEPKIYRDRNWDIVTACGILIACPLFPEKHARSRHSGTWQTVRFARRANKPVIIIRPDGKIIPDNGGSR